MFYDFCSTKEIRKKRGPIVLLFLLGLFVGGVFGVIIMSCLAVAKYDDMTSGRE